MLLFMCTRTGLLWKLTRACCETRQWWESGPLGLGLLGGCIAGVMWVLQLLHLHWADVAAADGILQLAQR
jgi:hypothetical protein